MNWKRALVVSLVVLLVLIGVPVLMPGMGGAMCSDCGPVVTTGQACLLAVLAGFALAIMLLGFRFRNRRNFVWDLLRSLDLERPPQLA